METQKPIYWIISFRWHFKKGKSAVTEQLVISGGWGIGRELIAMHEGNLGSDTNVLDFYCIGYTSVYMSKLTKLHTLKRRIYFMWVMP